MRRTVAPSEVRASGGEVAPRRARPPIVPWNVRAAEILCALRAFGRERSGGAIDARLDALFGPDGHPADRERALDLLIAEPGSAGDGRSLLRAFAEDGEGLNPAERHQVLRWERERRRGVFLLQRAHRDRMDLWDPLEGRRMVVHLPESLPPARAAELRRGTVVTAVTVPWGERALALGSVEMFEEEEAVRLFRTEVRNGGHAWHDPPPPAPEAT